MTTSPIMPGAEPYFARRGTTGVVLLHGFTATPHEVLWLGQHLAAQGFTVIAPRLAGHGTDPRDLARMTWRDWLASALDAYHLLTGFCDRIVVGGLSMGAALSLLMATMADVDGVCALAAPILPFRSLSVTRLRIVKRLRPYTDQTDRTAFAQYIIDQQTQRGERVLGRVRYNLWSTAAVEQLVRLVAHTRTHLAKVRAPVLAVYSAQDKTVLPLHLDALRAELVNSPRIEAHLLENSAHILTQDREQETVFRLVAEFVASVEK